MKRVLAACCFTWFFTKLIVVYLPPAVFWLLAAFFVCIFIGSLITKRQDYSRLLPCVGIAALLLHFVNITTIVEPVIALAGEKVEVVLLAEEVTPGIQDGCVRGRFTVQELNGKRLSPWKQFEVSCLSFPETERGELMRGILRLEELERNEYYYGNLADGVLLQGFTESHFQSVGYSHKLRFFMKSLQQSLSKNGRRYLPKKEGAVLTAMALGDKSHLSKELKEMYRAAGVSHLLVVSGLHLTLLCGAFLGNKPCGGRFRKLKAAGMMLFVLFVMNLTGFTPSVTRAGIAAIIFYLGVFLMLPADSITSLGVSAVFLSLQNCYAVCDLGLQLSFAATFGVITAVAMTNHKVSFEVKEQKIWKYRFNKGLQIVLVPAFAALFTLPLQLLYGISVSGVSVLTNLLTMPLISPIIILGLLTCITGAVPSLIFLTRLFALLAGLLIKMLNSIVKFTSELSVAQIRLPKEYTLFVLLVLFGLVWIAWKLRCLHWVIPTVPCLLLVALMLYNALQMNLIYIDLVGSKANPCAVIYCQNEAMVLFKGGESNRKQVEKSLKERDICKPSLWIDLRKTPKEFEIYTDKMVTVENCTEKQAVQVDFHGIIVTLIHTSSSNMAVMELQNYRVAMLTGTLQSGSVLQVDLLLAGASPPGMVMAQTAIVGNYYDWQSSYSNTSFYSISKEGSVQIRPGRSVQIKGAEHVIQRTKKTRGA